MTATSEVENTVLDLPRGAGTRKSVICGALLALLLTTFAVAPLTYPGFFQADTGFLPSFNVQHLSAAPNWGRSPDWMRGEGRLPYLVAWPIAAVTRNGSTAIKWGYGLSFMLAALGMYGWARRSLGVQGGVLAAAVYTYLPWHLGTVYTRGAYAEAWLWALWPAVLCAVDGLAGPHWRASALAALTGTALGFWIQPGLSVFFVVLVSVYAWVRLARRRLVWGSASALVLLGLLIGLARLLPRAPEPFYSDLLYPLQLFLPAGQAGAGIGGSERSFELGVLACGLGIVAVALRFGKRNDSCPQDRRLDRSLIFWLASIIVAVLFTLRLSAFLWRGTGWGSLIAQPWQLLALAGPGLAFVAASSVRTDRRLAKLGVWASLVALAILASSSYLVPRFTQVEPGPEPAAAFQPSGESEPEIYLLDAQVGTGTPIAQTLAVTLTWQTVAELGEDYTVFVHLLGEDGSRVSQGDSSPCSGACPTSTWQRGEILVDRHQLHIPQNAPQGRYRLSLGLYLLDSGKRVPIAGRDSGAVLLDVP